MSPANQDETPFADPETPRRTSPVKHSNATTPANRRASAHPGATPKSAPAAASHDSASKKRPEPSLLGDFFLGRPSPARLAAQKEALKHRRKSMADSANVREELRQEMRAAAVRRLQQPGGVTDRVKAWQKTNAAAMKVNGGGVPHAEDIASEPTEVAAHIAPESVTEKDRVRIKMRQKAKKKPARVEKSEDKENRDADDGADSGRDKSSGARSGGAPKRPQVVKLAPKKRIVSDDNWRNRRKGGGSPPRAGPPRPTAEGSPTPIPKDFLQRTARNPTVQNKIRDWAERVEVPEPELPRVKQYRHKKSGATVTVEEDSPRAMPSEPEHLAEPTPRPVDDGIRIKPLKPKKSTSDTGDGIRITPARKKEPIDDGIRVRPIETAPPDDGIRVRPIDSPPPDGGIGVQPSHEIPVEEPPVRPTSPRPPSVERRTSVPSTKRACSPEDVIEVIESPATEVETPPRRKASRRRSRRRNRSPSPVVRGAETTGYKHSDIEEVIPTPPRDSSDTGSERLLPTVLGNKPLADIPFGYSAFSVLDLPLGPEARKSGKRPKAQRNQSFKEAMPKVFKKVVEGAKEIIQERVEAPRPAAANKPQSIESWLNDTVDPFAESPSKAQPDTKEPAPELPKQAPTSDIPKQAPENQKRPPPRPPSRPPSSPPSENRPRETPAHAAPKKPEPKDVTVAPEEEDSDATPTKGKAAAVSSTGLKRRRATRIAASPAKSTGKTPFRDLLKAAFRGESVGHKLPPTVYPSCEADEDHETDYDEDSWVSTDERSGYTDQRKRPLSPEYSSTYDSTLSSDLSSHGPPRTRPPTNGVHELSTIVSEEHSSTAGSEAVSDVSQTTITQTTALTKSSLSRQKGQRPGPKRRLTKHSDLVSVLSQPDDGHLMAPSRSRSIQSSRSLHRRPSRADKGKADELLDEFADDEYFYERELKAVVDGVIPVLLKDVLSGGAKGSQAEAMAKSVVNMGMALESLRDFHRQVPLGDITELLFWLEDVSPAYDRYLNVWRLGFQGLIVNLAPRLGRMDDNDSLLDALPLNEDGDIIGENGERVDVAYLLKRPLIRIKWMVRFLRAAVAVTGTRDAEDLLSVFDALQQKARTRHREETARMMDEDANNTDTTRCRDLRNLLPLDGILMNRTRQVAALDVFALDLDHSSGQRLECQVELIHRDNPAIPGDKGDIFIREIGNSARSWLLFPPVPWQYISARRDDGDPSLIVMIRGTHNGNEWFELLQLATNSEEQIVYWLSILGSYPVPPATRRRPRSMELASTSPKPDGADIPVGERRRGVSSGGSPGPERPRSPSQHHTRQDDDPPSTPPSASPNRAANASPDCTPTQADYRGQRRPSWEALSYNPPKAAKPAPNSTPFREDGAPPPPIHRTLSSKSPGLLAPPGDLGPKSRLKRKHSSPLKHEYHPSDVSSDSSCSMSDEDSESLQSSSDELDEDEVPDTIPGYSIKEDEVAPVGSLVSDVNSITPSNSASQAGITGQDKTKPERLVHRFTASVSYWSSRKGVWKDINNGLATPIVVHPGCMEIHHLGEQHSNRQAYPLQSSGTSEVDNTNKDAGSILPLVLLPLTPVVMIRRSTAVDLEVRSPSSPESRLKIEAGMFRFRAATLFEAKDLYEAVHVSRLNNARYIQLSEEARVRSFGQMQAGPADGSADGDSSSRRRNWLGRKNSYRASTRAPSVSQGSMSTTISAGSFLRRLMGGGNPSFNIDESSIDKHQHQQQQQQRSRPGSAGGNNNNNNNNNNNSLYTSGSGSGSGSGSSGATTPPRSIDLSQANSGGGHSRWSSGLAKKFSPDQPLQIRCHLNVHNNRWQDKGDCVLHISRPPPGVRQELPLYGGLEKRVIVTRASGSSSSSGGGGGDASPLILLDAVLGSGCFGLLGTKGVMCSVWENLRDEEGRVGVAPRQGTVAARVTKWCFQCKSVQQADWIMRLLTSEVSGLMMG
ncbi:hypothetical protein BT67DRAFT_13954 [Trichocladium antarcticum]|uniref:Uncharacterized protein n=1 Tax=Trichocladium antarcticum TaxID=1450529 RepID=A0AAN6UT32_9PEZI|nr:hypothetical protein BT67DRAFT_13954 [Trichocladium antarcticum]